jgi:hypothetical protein
MRTAVIQQFPPSSAPLLNPDGTLGQVWYQFFLTIHRREGGSQDDIFALLVSALVQATQFQQLSGQFSEVDDRFAEIEARLSARGNIDDLVDDLRAQIESLTQQQGLIQQQLQASDTEAELQNLEAQVLALTQFGYQATSLNDLNARIDGLTTDQVAEGTTNLYFTQARARNSISLTSATSDLTYTPATGVFVYTRPANVSTASAWQTARTFTFTGNVTGSLGPIDGSANASAALTIANGAITTSMLAFTLATVATSGAYSDLTGKPSLATVATSGSYTDLINQPIGTYTATPGTITGYIMITDSGGTPRKVAVTT